MSSVCGYGIQAVKLTLSDPLICATSENTASGTAKSIDMIQMAVAFIHVHRTALDVWMSIGFTIALYLKEGKIYITKVQKTK
ncbi:hypothetical protein GDO81_028758 [Engystomops pustulosus]|uniref:Uncharacterized protein n=1 Tax=Engystomops pustulosus TaxID=76066 RepID=A0AAV6YF21_ENGPU|nr:hypothetical protein GDO81_028758 [Engystomops pustulosus]